MASIPNPPPVSLDPETAGKRGYDFYRKIGSPKFVVAPMVNQSEVGFRMLTRKYKADLCYTPMMQAKKFGEDATYRRLNFDGLPEDRPLFTQFCANDPQQLLAAAKCVETQCDAVDINLGCPQGIARRGHYGSFLLEEPDLIVSMVSTLHQNLAIPVTCKIRKLPNDDDTLKLCHRLQAAGCAILTVHGRTKEMKKDRTGICDWNIIRRIKQELTIPVFANGSIECLADVERCMEYTGVDGVMVSEAILENPALFASNEPFDSIALAQEYLDFAKKYPSPLNRSALKPHLFKLLFKQLSVFTDVRSLLGSKGVEPSVIDSIPKTLLEHQTAKLLESPPGTDLYAHVPKWYNRHHKPRGSGSAAPAVASAEAAPATAAAAANGDASVVETPSSPPPSLLDHIPSPPPPPEAAGPPAVGDRDLFPPTQTAGDIALALAKDPSLALALTAPVVPPAAAQEAAAANDTENAAKRRKAEVASP